MKSHLASARQGGMVLVTSLLLLVVVTILAVSMFRSFGLDERIAGNIREKERALNAAEAAELAAESWLSLGNGGVPITCAAGVTTYPTASVCINNMTVQGVNPAVVPWTMGAYFIPGGADGVATMTTGSGNYSYSKPQFFIGYLGSTTTSNITTNYYQIDAAGYGGSAETVAVVEATYTTTSGGRNAGGP